MNNEKCGAKTKDGTPCEKWPINGTNRCRLHGGNTPRGLRSPNWKHGRYSRYLPDGILSKYKKAQKDNQLLVLKDEIALTDSFIAETLEQLDRDESGAIWKNLQAAAKEYRNAVAKGDKDESGRMIDIILMLIAEGNQQLQIKREVVNLMDSRRKLVESERKRYQEDREMITHEKALSMINAIMHVVIDRVQDKQIVSLIIEDMKLLTERTGGDD